MPFRVSLRQYDCWAGGGGKMVKFYSHLSHPCFFLVLGHDVPSSLFFRFNGIVELGRGVFGFPHALRPPLPPVRPDPWLWGHIVLLVLTPVIRLCRQ